MDLEGARRALDRGAAVVLPNPAPLTCVLTATTPTAVNEAKGRPGEQPVAVWAHSPGAVGSLAPFLDLGAPDTDVLRRLLTDELLTVLVPLTSAPRPPEWLRPAVKDGWALLFGARWLPLRPLLDRFPLLYVSSANRTGCPPVADAAAAMAVFPAGTAVLGAIASTRETGTPNELRRGNTPPARSSGAGRPFGTGGTGQAPPRAATTTVRLYRGGRLALHRHGAQDRSHADAAAYLATLAEG
ncbi:tRNA A37 threonylcarbamoyladenosine synthetase subunit TsaC/SUA5/YrdC [Streptomyces sp. TLI_171]|nr:tRNA A37 threonylcarbamoyladenosine synthetase subunit TsaC/SUA5/YrdC [Streptomyces sp. TLI_171]